MLPASLSTRLAVRKRARHNELAVRDVPGSGTPAELLAAGIDTDHIVKTVRSLLG